MLLFSSGPSLDLPRRGGPRHGRRVWRELFLHAHRQASLLSADVHVFYRGDRSEFPLLPAAWQAQDGHSFGERLHHAVQCLFNAGYDQLVILGHDVPHLTADHIRRAFDALERASLVIGPDDKGGCYLLGLARQDVRWIESIQWQRNGDCGEIQRRVAVGDVALLVDRLKDLDSPRDFLTLDLRGLETPLRSALLSSRAAAHKAPSHPCIDLRPFLAAARRTITLLQLPPPLLRTCA